MFCVEELNEATIGLGIGKPERFHFVPQQSVNQNDIMTGLVRLFVRDTSEVYGHSVPNLSWYMYWLHTLWVPSLSHWGRVAQICVSKFTIISLDNGLAPIRRQAIIWTNAGILLIRSLGTNFSEILIQIHTFSNKKMHAKMSSGKCRPFCLGLNVLWDFCSGRVDLRRVGCFPWDSHKTGIADFPLGS